MRAAVIPIWVGKGFIPADVIVRRGDDELLLWVEVVWGITRNS